MKNDIERAQKAFEQYFALGETRSLKVLARKYKYSINTVTKWSVKHNWTGKLIDRLNEAELLAQREAIKNIAEQRSQYIVGMHNALVQFFEKVTSGEIPAKDFNDMDKILKNLRLEMGPQLEVMDE